MIFLSNVITIKLPIKFPDKEAISSLQNQYSIVVRYSYNRFKTGEKLKSVRNSVKSLNNIGLLNFWVRDCAILEGKSIYTRFKDKFQFKVFSLKSIKSKVKLCKLEV